LAILEGFCFGNQRHNMYILRRTLVEPPQEYLKVNIYRAFSENWWGFSIVRFNKWLDWRL